MKSSWGSVTRHSCSTVRPPTPESKTPIGRVSMGRSLGAKMDDRYLRDVQGARHGLAPVMSDLRSRRSRMAGSVNIGNIDATEDTARGRFAAVATSTID